MMYSGLTVIKTKTENQLVRSGAVFAFVESPVFFLYFAFTAWMVFIIGCGSGASPVTKMARAVNMPLIALRFL